MSVTRVRRHRLCLAAACWLVAVAGSPAAAHQIEPTADCAEGATSSILYRAHTRKLTSPFECKLAPGATDVYGFEGAQGDNVRVFLTKLGFDFEPRFEVRGPADELIVASEACSGQPALCFDGQSLPPLAATGTYEIRITSTDAGDDFDFYRLQLERIAPASFDPDDIAFQAGRDAFSDFNTIDPEPDIDHFGIEVGESHGRLDFTLTGLSGLEFAGFDPRVEIWDPAGQLVGEASCDGGGRFDDPCSTQLQVDVSGPGLYTFALSDLGSDEIGAYEYSWSLPEPAAGLQVASVVLALGLMRRRPAERRRPAC